MKSLIVSGFKSAFLPYGEKSDLLQAVVTELDSFDVKDDDTPVTAEAPPRAVCG